MANAMSVETHDPQGPSEWHDHIAQYGYVIVHNALPEENLAATEVELSADELRELGTAAPKIPVRGARYPEELQKLVGR